MVNHVDTISILISRHYGFEGRHATTMYLENILPVLQKKVNVKIIWLFYLPEKQDLPFQKNSDTMMIDIHDYDNAVEVIQKTQPDLILDSEYPSLIDLSLDFAARYLNVPVITRMYSTFNFKLSRKQFFTSFIKKLFESTIPYEKDQKKGFMRRGRFFLFKYIFLLKTMKVTRMRLDNIIKHFFIVLKIHISHKVPFIDSRFENTLHVLESEMLVKPMLNAGFHKSHLAVIGNPMYDSAFKKFRNLTPLENKSDKIRVLFLPLQLYEIGYWTKNQRDFAVKEIIREISQQKDKISLIVKIHPSAQVLQEYKFLVHSIDSSILVYQKGDVIDYLDNIDVVVSFPPNSTALIYSLIAKKPLLLCNFFFDQKGILLEKIVATECNEPSLIIESIHKLQSFNPATKNFQKFIKEFLFKGDGNACERFTDAILRLLAKN